MRNVNSVWIIALQVVTVICILWASWNLINYKKAYRKRNISAERMGLICSYGIPLVFLFWPFSHDYWSLFPIKLYLVILFYVAITIGLLIDLKLRKHFGDKK